MKQAESIQSFIMGTAYYYVASKGGDEAVLQIDYHGNTYTIEKRSKTLDLAFQRDLSEIAEDLLQRKHGVNFAEKLQERS